MQGGTYCTLHRQKDGKLGSNSNGAKDGNFLFWVRRLECVETRGDQDGREV